jgi:hypothetical protein
MRRASKTQAPMVGPINIIAAVGQEKNVTTLAQTNPTQTPTCNGYLLKA